MKLLDHLRCFLSEFRLYVCNEWVTHIPSHAIRNYYYRRMMGFKIAPTASIFMHCRFDAKGGFTLGERSVINRGCRVDTRAGVVIGNDVSISEEVHIITNSHRMDSPEFEGYGDSIVIGDLVFVGPRVILLPGVKIGRGALVGAGAVVTRDAEAFTMVAGVPAAPVRVRDSQLEYRLPVYRRLFH
jgi:maltose O-acetyltransferase